MISRSRLLVYKFSHYKDVVSKFKNFEFTAMNAIIYIFLLIAGFAVSTSYGTALPLANYENKLTIYILLLVKWFATVFNKWVIRYLVCSIF